MTKQDSHSQEGAPELSSAQRTSPTSAPSDEPSKAKREPNAHVLGSTLKATKENAKDKSLGFLRLALGLCGLIAVVLALLLWDKLSHVQELLARQSADTSQLSLEAKAIAKESLEMSRDTAAKLALTQNKLNEVVLQRSQMEALVQSLSRSRDETLIDDIEASLKLAQQQALLTGSLQPLLAALKNAEERLLKVSQPRFSTLQRAVAKDMDRVKSSSLADTPSLLIQFDEMLRLMDELPLTNDMIKSKDKPLSSPSPALGSDWSANSASAPQPELQKLSHKDKSSEDQMTWAQTLSQAWWQKMFAVVWQEFKGLVRVSQIDQPQGVLLSPEQAYFVRENLKLRLLNARMALLARQVDGAKADALLVQNEIQHYFDLHQKSTAVALSLLQNIQLNLKQLQLPPLSESFAAIAQLQAQAGH